MDSSFVAWAVYIPHAILHAVANGSVTQLDRLARKDNELKIKFGLVHLEHLEPTRLAHEPCSVNIIIKIKCDFCQYMII